jgi:hypothetical protein
MKYMLSIDIKIKKEKGKEKRKKKKKINLEKIKKERNNMKTYLMHILISIHIQ